MAAVALAQGDRAVWVLADEGLFEMAEGRLTPVSIPRPSSRTSEGIAAAGAVVAVAVAPGQNSLLVLESTDGGASWATRGPVSLSSPTVLADLRLALIGPRIVVLGSEQSGSQVSTALVASSADAGQSWTVEQAPSGGDVSAAGDRFWLVGGVMGDELFTSDSGSTWQRVHLPVDAQFWTAGRPVALATGEVVLPVTTHSANETEALLTFWASQALGCESVAGSSSVSAQAWCSLRP
jgi:hypothetical protein